MNVYDFWAICVIFLPAYALVAYALAGAREIALSWGGHQPGHVTLTDMILKCADVADKCGGRAATGADCVRSMVSRLRQPACAE